MPPVKNSVKAPAAAIDTNTRTTRSKTSLTSQEADGPTNLVAKRKAENVLNTERKKRSALGNLTNANVLVNKNDVNQLKDVGKTDAEQQKGALKKSGLKSVLPIFTKPTGPSARPPVHSKIQTRASKGASTVQSQPPNWSNLKPAALVPTETKKNAEVTKTARRLSNDFEKSENSLYVSALEYSSTLEVISSQPEEDEGNKVKDEKSSDDTIELQSVPEDVDDFDKENWNDPYQVSEYAMHIFEYMKNREPMFQIKDYLANQKNLTKWMRALLVDWMVEVQESFELNHETLYLAVKLVDRYLYLKHHVHKDRLQLLGAASLLIACKYDERIPPSVDDFLYICDGAYTQKELIQQEVHVFSTIGFDLGIPISYRFLRRYARCAKVPMSTLTLARFILEYSLMDYTTITLSDSKLACGALFIALRMCHIEKPWSKTLEFYSGYKIQDFASIVVQLNENLQRKPKESLNTVRNKYSHTIFHEVAKIPLLSNEKLLENYPDLTIRETDPIVLSD